MSRSVSSVLREMAKAEREKFEADGKGEHYADLFLVLTEDEQPGGRVYVKAWRGGQSKPYANYYFSNPENRAKWIEREKKYADDRVAMKQSRNEKLAAARATFVNPFELGDILHHSWGYEQTQCDYYQVVAKTAKTITVKEIASKTVPGSEGFMCDHRMPVKDKFLETKRSVLYDHGEPPAEGMVKTVNVTVDGQYYVSTKYGWMTKWDGQAKYCSWYA